MVCPWTPSSSLTQFSYTFCSLLLAAVSKLLRSQQIGTSVVFSYIVMQTIDLHLQFSVISILCAGVSYFVFIWRRCRTENHCR
uniref:Uncharacterized protein n=1 Tax=Ixodes ricinus TaxID=34613 RepID=A0A6B0U7Y5_IXORI